MSPSSIIVTRNPNQSTKILCYGTGYAKEKILSPLKRLAWGRLHCWFCLKLLRVHRFILWWSTCNISDTNISEYSTTNTSNYVIGKYYVAKKKHMVFLPLASVNKLENMNLNQCIDIFLRENISYTGLEFHNKNS
jgi:hypothetical protein